MDLEDMFRSFFGLRNRRNIFEDRNLMNEDDVIIIDLDDEQIHPSTNGHEEYFHQEFPFFFGGRTSSLDDMFHHFHSGMHQQMESILGQMDDIFKGFGTIRSDNFPPIMDTPESAPRGFSRNFSLPGPGKKENPRDFMLKQDEMEKSKSIYSPTIMIPPNAPSQDHKTDSDLDGKVSSSDMLKMIKKPEREIYDSKPVQPHSGFFSSNSVTFSSIQGPDGKMEQKRIVRDSSGREESTVTRSIDGKTHTVTTIKDQNGQEERHETFQNMGEDDINKFDEKWKLKQAPRQPPSLPESDVNLYKKIDQRDWSLFSKFFKDF